MKNTNDYSFDILDIPLSKYGSHVAVAIEEEKLSVYNALEQAGITIPFPQRDVHMLSGNQS